MKMVAAENVEKSTWLQLRYEQSNSSIQKTNKGGRLMKRVFKVLCSEGEREGRERQMGRLGLNVVTSRELNRIIQ